MRDNILLLCENNKHITFIEIKYYEKRVLQDKKNFISNLGIMWYNAIFDIMVHKSARRTMFRF